MQGCSFLLVSILVASPIAAGLTVGRRSHHHRHARHGLKAGSRHHSERHPERGVARQRRSRTHDVGHLSIDDALGRLPAKVGDLFTAFLTTGDDSSATGLRAELNAAYKNAMSENDTVTLDCLGRTENLTEEVRIARVALTHVESRLTQTQDRMQSLQAAIDRSLAEIETLRSEFLRRRTTCEQDRQNDTDLLANLTKDLPLGESLVENLVAGCVADSNANGPALLECSMPDETVVVTFKEEANRIKASSLDVVTQRLLADALSDAAHRGQVRVATGASLLRLRFVQRRLRQQVHQRKTSHKQRRGSRALPGPDVDMRFCTNAATVSCAGFGDAMATFIGSVKDLMDEVDVRIEDHDKKCQVTSQDESNFVQDLKQQAEEGSVDLANTVAEQGALTALRQQRRIALQDITQEADLGVGECTRQLSQISDTMCSTDLLWKQLGMGTFVGDCEVSGWSPGPCSKPCGSGGVQNLTRRVVTGNNSQCPTLHMSRSCNERPCPIDAKMGQWDEWTECSRECGGGTRTRRREVLTEAQNGGLPSAETLEEQICNPLPCDRDCQLSSWTDWSDCSKACQGGHRVRVRTVLQPPLGQGSCPAFSDPHRRETKHCNMMSCNRTDETLWPRCASALDMMLVLDGSGSVGSEGWTDVKEFAKGVTLAVLKTKKKTTNQNIIDINGPLPDEVFMGVVNFGVVKFSNSATVVQELAGDSEKVLDSIEAMTWPGNTVETSATNTAAALAVARRMREDLWRKGKPLHHNAPGIVVVVTDGVPSSSRLMSVEVQKLKDMGLRVTFVSVGKGIPTQSLKQWASWPPAENLVEVASYKDAAALKGVSDLVIDICPRLWCGGGVEGCSR